MPTRVQEEGFQREDHYPFLDRGLDIGQGGPGHPQLGGRAGPDPRGAAEVAGAFRLLSCLGDEREHDGFRRRGDSGHGGFANSGAP